MNLYDTRFFFEHFYSDDEATLSLTRSHLRAKETKFVSAVTIHELFKQSTQKEGRDVAQLRASLVEKEFEVIPMDAEIAKSSAELRSKYPMPMADSVVAASAQAYRLVCVTDDPHFSRVKEIKASWL